MNVVTYKDSFECSKFINYACTVIDIALAIYETFAVQHLAFAYAFSCLTTKLRPYNICIIMQCWI